MGYDGYAVDDALFAECSDDTGGQNQNAIVGPAARISPANVDVLSQCLLIFFIINYLLSFGTAFQTSALLYKLLSRFECHEYD